MAYLPAPGEHPSATEQNGHATPFLRRYGVAILVALLTGAFLLAPWSFENKAHVLLHGICGQTESHTVTLGGMALPLDNRCVGIFAGLLMTFIILIGAGRSRAASLPSTAAGLVLLGFLVTMAIDGLNSLLTDLDRWHPYTPSNDLRLITGWMTGIGLGTLLIMVSGMSLWQRPRTSMRVLPGIWWPFALLLPCLPIWVLLRSGSPAAYYLISLLLIAAAVTAFAALAVCASVMLRNRDNFYDRAGELSLTMMFGILVAVAILLFLSGGRFWLERTFGLAPVA